jgi:hypothetical protein
VRGRRRTDAQAFAQLIEELPSDDAAALLAALPALEHLRELAEVQRARSTDSRTSKQSDEPVSR